MTLPSFLVIFTLYLQPSITANPSSGQLKVIARTTPCPDNTIHQHERCTIILENVGHDLRGSCDDFFFPLASSKLILYFLYIKHYLVLGTVSLETAR